MRIPAIVAGLMLFAGVAFAEPPSIPESAVAEARALQQQALGGSGAFALVESLTTEVGPRLMGTPGDAAGVAWALRTMKELGFSNVRAEPAEGIGWLRGEERAETLAPFRQPLSVTALGGSGATPAGGLAADLVLFDDVDALLAAPVGSLAGKIAFINARTTRTQTGAGYGLVADGRERGPEEAAKRGAAGFLIRSVGTSQHRFPHTGNTRFADGTPRIPAAALSNADANMIERLAARGPVRLNLALTPRQMGPVRTHNVIGEIPGREAPEEIVLLGAHLDSWDLGTGAIDDGAGVGIVLAAGRLILERKQRPRRTIRVVLFGAEEVGLVGARAYLSAYRETLANHIVGTEADMGAGPVVGFATKFPPEAMPAADIIHRALRPLGVARMGNEARGGPDMGPLREAGMPVVTLQLDGTDYFDTHHTANDTLDRVDATALDQSVAAYGSFAWTVAQGRGSFRPAAAAGVGQ